MCQLPSCVSLCVCKCMFVCCCLRWSSIRVQSKVQKESAHQNKETNKATRQKIQQLLLITIDCTTLLCRTCYSIIHHSFFRSFQIHSFHFGAYHHIKRLPCESVHTSMCYIALLLLLLNQFVFDFRCVFFRCSSLLLLLFLLLYLSISISISTFAHVGCEIAHFNGINCMS